MPILFLVLISCQFCFTWLELQLVEHKQMDRFVLCVVELIIKNYIHSKNTF